MHSSSKTAGALAAGLMVAGLGAGFTPALAAQATPARSVPAVDVAAQGSVVEVTSANKAQVKEMAKSKPVVFLVTAPSWCGACRQLDPVIHDLNAKAGGTWTLAVIDTDKAKDAAQEFGVRGLPTMIPWGKSGEMKSPARMVGWGGQGKTSSWIDSVVKAYGPTKPGPKPAPKPAPTKPGPKPGPKPAPTKPGPKPAPTKPGPKPAPVPTSTPAPAPVPGDGKLPTLPAGAVQLTDKNFQKEVIQESAKRTVVIDFSKDQCEPCLALAPIMDEKYKADKGSWQYTRLDGTAFPELWKKFDNPWFPTLIAFRDGKEIARHTGYEGDKAAITAWLDGVAKGQAPANDPLVMELKDTATWNQMIAMSKRHPVALRVHMGRPFRKHGEMAEKMVKADGGKWSLVNADLPTVACLLHGRGVRPQGMPIMYVFYNGKMQLKPLVGFVQEPQMRQWIDTMLSTHYPKA
ncbi:thioredoxin family protein [Arsenicicoccus dermatophilus]|uniref:thioredoxin family protein n=1 Tax=Arsenicicoccus dermatophilus TaxID=1076331 RepID=UPI001F4CC26F|nr:thioredoxin domain-containing protein [Arsenicicoccus dermatophilus]MCH8613925.1 thioredoxin domain-containing protein [Arsenicicoccus dermatophilus]